MKRFALLTLSVFASAILAIGASGCYTQIAVRESWPRDDYRQEYPEYSETYSDSGTTIINNYYGGYPRSSTYFHFYYPSRWSYMWSSYYDPWYSDWYSPWSWRSSWGYWDPWYWGPTAYYYGGGYYNPWYVHYPYHRYWDNYYSLPLATRTRGFGATRTRDGLQGEYGTTRALSPSSRENAIRATSTRSRSTEIYDRISTRSRDRSTIAAGGSTIDAGRTRDRSSTAPAGDTRSRERVNTTPDNSGSRDRSVSPPSDNRSRERSSPPPSDTRSRERSSYSPPSSSQPSSGSRSGGSSGGSSRSSGSSGSSGRSRTR